ncbi:hypothetical protein OW763_09285 [Clostridium aestuarii]|uniref:Uncharacterized protein n=1 Tax=Clostridium aestuarii TaxID=338193 RepID=A0ABT4CZW9_9CLOT|nr:hypothetical protein [Clostridium aestuarii]MCY6484532.1 hypothetical protein [Clostridium aestuarii]
MKIKTKVLSCLAIVGCISTAAGISANAKTDAYLIKDKSNSVIYEYDSKTLIDGFLNYSETNQDSFYEDFISRVSKSGTYAYHDSTNKYVSFETVRDAFLDANEEGKTFSLMTFTESDDARAMTNLPQTIKSVKINDGEISYKDKNTGGSGEDTEEEPLRVISIE